MGMRSFTGVAGLLAVSGVASASFLLVPESTTDQVMLLNANTGRVIDANFLDIATQATAAGVSSTPIEALEVNGEFWVSDQVADRIWRFGQDGSFLGDIGAGGDFNNIRGMELVGSTLYVAQGSDSDNYPEGIITVDTTTNMVTGSFIGVDPADASYWDVKSYNGELLVTNSDSGNDAIERYDTNGNLLGFFAQSDGLSDFDFMQQMNVRGSNGNLLGGGFSLPAGVYEFAPDGTPLGIVAGDGFGPRAAWELANGAVMWTNGTWIRTDNRIIAEGSSFRFISPVNAPAPGVASVLGLAGVMGLRRRR